MNEKNTMKEDIKQTDSVGFVSSDIKAGALYKLIHKSRFFPTIRYIYFFMAGIFTTRISAPFGGEAYIYLTG